MKKTNYSVISELNISKKQYIKLLNSYSAEELNHKSNNPGWTNGEILFHILFAYIIVSALLPLISFFGKLPKNYSKIFADVLNRSTPIFNFVNGLGARGGAKVFKGKRLKVKAVSVFNSLVIKAETMRESDWKLGMYFPEKWDSLFDEYMTFEKVFHYPTKHFLFHLKQISHRKRLRK